MELLSEKEADSFLEMEKILSSLANHDALNIFYSAKDGIKSSTKTIQELKLTQKRYYTRLNSLMAAGLIEKNENAYCHTMLGSVCYRLGEIFDKALSERERLDLLTKLKDAKALSMLQKKQIAEAISVEDITEFGDMSNLINSVRLVDKYESLVQETIELLEKAESEVYFATKYFDTRIVEAISRGVQREVKFSFVYSIEDTTREKMGTTLKMMLTSPKTSKVFYDWLKSSDLNIRIIDLNYTFMVIDAKYAIVEVQKPFINVFSLAFIFDNPVLCQRLIENFNSLWKKGANVDSLTP